MTDLEALARDVEESFADTPFVAKRDGVALAALLRAHRKAVESCLDEVRRAYVPELGAWLVDGKTVETRIRALLTEGEVTT